MILRRLRGEGEDGRFLSTDYVSITCITNFITVLSSNKSMTMFNKIAKYKPWALARNKTKLLMK